MLSSCATCNETFASTAEMRQHFRSDFHAENVRRRVDGQPPLSPKDFARREDEGREKQEGVDLPAFTCNLCSKHFHSVNTLQAHVKSTKHLIKKEERLKEKERAAGGSDAAASATSLGSAAIGLHKRSKAHHHDAAVAAAVDGKERPHMTTKPKVSVPQREADVDETTCFFCGCKFKVVNDNLTHMEKWHNFIIPMRQRCHNLKGLLQYLSRKVNGLLCLVCNEGTKRFHTLEAVRAHMRECGHEYIRLGPEYQDFYSGKLLDPDAPSAVEEDERFAMPTQIVIREGTKVVYRRDEHIPLRKIETPKQIEKRHLITASETSQALAVKREQYEALKEGLRKEILFKRRETEKRNKFEVSRGVNENSLHPLGWCGNKMFDF